MAQFNVTAGSIAGKVLIGGVSTLVSFPTPAASFSLPSNGTYTLAWDYKNWNGGQVGVPTFVMYSGNTTTDYNDPIPMWLITQIGGVITHTIDRRLQGAVASSNIQPGAVNISHLDPVLIAAMTSMAASGVGLTTLNKLSDVDISSPINGQILSYQSSTGLWVNSTDSSIQGPQGIQGPIGPQGVPGPAGSGGGGAEGPQGVPGPPAEDA